MSGLWELKTQFFSQIYPLADNNYSLSCLRYAVVCHIHEINRCDIASSFKVRYNLLDCFSFAKAKNTFYILSNEKFRLLDFDGVVEKAVKLVSVIFESSQPVSL